MRFSNKGWRVTIDGAVYEGRAYTAMPDAVFAALLKYYNDFNAAHPFERLGPDEYGYRGFDSREAHSAAHPANQGQWLIGVERIDDVKHAKMRRVDAPE